MCSAVPEAKSSGCVVNCAEDVDVGSSKRASMQVFSGEKLLIRTDLMYRVLPGIKEPLLAVGWQCGCEPDVR